jgi:hypothetical protein
MGSRIGKGKERMRIVKMVGHLLRDLMEAGSPWVKQIGGTWPTRLKGWRSVDKSTRRQNGRMNQLQGTL